MEREEGECEVEEVVEELEEELEEVLDDDCGERKEDINGGGEKRKERVEDGGEIEEVIQKLSIKRQKLATGKKKKNKKEEEKKENKENFETKESKNPFKEFLDSVGDKSKSLANSVMKEKDELFAKFQNVNIEPSNSPKSASLRNDEVKTIDNK